jgi:aspartate kinase
MTIFDEIVGESIVCKFGGSSVADAAQIEKVVRIVAADDRRRFVVVSAPGRSFDDEEKVTDHLFNIASDGYHFAEQRKPISGEESRKAVLGKFSDIVGGLELDGADLLEELEADFDTDLIGDRRAAFLASRGEHYSARIVARHLQNTGTPARVCLPEDFGFEVEGSFLDAKLVDATHARIGALDGADAVTVIPGYYGVTGDGDVAVFSRGGSDLTGGEVASALNAGAYENWTDVSGVLEADPSVIPEARAIPRLTFKEIRLLSSKGFNVFHFDAMLNCRKAGVPIHIRNTNRPDDPGTRILNERVPEEGIVGIARLDDVAYIYLEKDALSEELGFTAALLTIFQRFGINTIHYPTDKDDIAVLVQQEDLKGSINDLRRAIESELQPDAMDVVYNLSILTPVGLGLKGNSRPIVDAINALGEENIPIQMFHQSPSQLCFHIGVGQTVADDASRLLYSALIDGTS